ncbi:DUF4259 domain-containing protein [uncultured Fusobacterium sp.]|uniref:DUF4259 domain-containing protein n=1 Tax=uncultured Fusobacterium sp. TaxID=159267 RepID=UPI0025F474F9|nr:DUF4259 domain-containing protein [uncultured Fusobacterium sp.]
MGAWGIKALESDEGLDVVDVLREYLEEFEDKKEITLKEIIDLMIEEGMLGETFEEIEFLYDNTAMAVSELYFDFKENGKLDYDYDDEETTFSKLEKFSSDKKSLKYLIDYLTNIYNKVPDEDEEREIVELWYENGQNPNYEEWYNHLGSLIEKLKAEYKS